MQNAKKLLIYALSLCLLCGVVSPAAALAGVKAAPASEAIRLSGELHRLTGTYDAGRSGSAVKKAPDSGGKSDSAPVYDPDGSEFQTARLIVKAKGETSDEAAVGSVYMGNDLTVLQYGSEADARAAYARLQNAMGVKYVEPDRIASATSEHLSWGYGTDYVDADPFTNWIYGTYPELPEVTVAVIDTGVYADHPFLAGRVDTDHDYDFVNDDDDADDDSHHGTHVAGTVVDGTLPNVKILPIKVLGANGNGSMTQICLGIDYAIEQQVDVINLSLGGEGTNDLIEEVVNRAIDAGIVVCIAAGNEQYDAENWWPANVEPAITVAAIDEYNSRAFFSNFGECVDISAPGSEIVSSVPCAPGAPESLMFEAESGTSMACPHVAAAAANIRSYRIGADTEEVLAILTAAVKPIDDPLPMGCGILCMSRILPEDAARLSLGETQVEMFPDQTLALPFSNETGETAVWSSSDPATVSVADGTLHALQTGSAGITVTAGGQIRRCQVTVSPLSFSLNAGQAIRYFGQLEPLAYTLSHDSASVVWRSSDDSILTFSDGIPVPVGEGNVTVTAVVGDGTASRVERTAQVTVRQYGAWYTSPEDEDNYVLTSALDLYELSVVSRAEYDSFAGKTVTVSPSLTELDMQSFDAFLPIGTNGVGFSGTFDGSGVPIRNLTVDMLEDAVTVEQTSPVGLFSHLNWGGVVRGVALENVSVRGVSDVGGVCGQMNYGAVIDGCSVSGSVEALTNYAGGVAGKCVNGTIRNCENHADVRSRSIAGGICGGLYYGGKIVNCVNDGAVAVAVGNAAAGIAADASIAGSSAALSAVPDLGNEEQEMILNCVNAGAACYGIAHTMNDVLIENTFWLETASVSALKEDLTVEELRTEENAPRCYAFTAALTAPDAPRPDVIDALTCYALRLNDKCGEDLFVCWDEKDGLPALLNGCYQTDSTYLWFAEDEIIAVLGDAAPLDLRSNHDLSSVAYAVSDPLAASVSTEGILTLLAPGRVVVTATADGQSVELVVNVLDQSGWYNRTDETLWIASSEELAEFAAIVNAGADDFAGRTVALSADIDLSDYETWTPIGGSAAESFFAGCFDGKGHSVNGLSCADHTLAEFGLFGTIAPGAAVRGVRLTNVSIFCGLYCRAGAVCSRVSYGAAISDCVTENGRFTEVDFGLYFLDKGGIVACNEGTVENCINNLTMCFNGTASYGGVAGLNRGVIDGCANNTALRASGSTGGICGCNDFDGVVANCVNRGEITPRDSAFVPLHMGGVAGECCGLMANCVNCGALPGGGPSLLAFGYFGGLCGTGNDYLSFLDNCVNEGAVGESAGSAAICGVRLPNDNAWSNLYWLDSSAAVGVADTPDDALTNAFAYGEDRRLPGGASLLDALNARVETFNAARAEEDQTPLYRTWYADGDDRLTFAPGCAHTRTTVDQKDATCLHEGYTVTICADCGLRLSDLQTIPKTDHIRWQYTVTEPTCTTEGTAVWGCSNCMEEHEITLPALGHADVDGDGYCDRCGEAVAADTMAFEEYRETQLALADALRREDDSEAVTAIIDEAVAALTDHVYDKAKTPAENEEALSEALSAYADQVRSRRHAERQEILNHQPCSLCGEHHTGSLLDNMIGIVHGLIWIMQSFLTIAA